MPSMTPEVPSALSPLIRRVVADNPGLMTGPGTNSYLVGIDAVAGIDPGPDIQTHAGALVGAFGKSPKADDVKLDLDLVLDEGDTVDGTEFRLEVLHTPGHAPNHLCFLLDEERALFTGDHVLNGTTTVVNPERGGDMVEYLASLDRLRKIKRVARICPGHGDVIDDPAAVLDEYVAHRKQRERQIMRLLAKGPAKIPDIVSTLYVDTPEGLLEMAARQ